MVGRTMPSPETWMMSGLNHPLAPASYLTAEELSTMSADAIRVLLTQRAQISEPPPPPVKKVESSNKGKREGELQFVTTSGPKQKNSPAKGTGSQGEKESMLKQGEKH